MRYLLCLLLFSASCLVADEPKGWLENYEQARHLAQASKRPLLLVFLGGSSCPWSEKLEKEVLSDPQFTAFLEEDCVLVKLSHEAQAEEPKGSLQMQEWPSILLLTSEGEEIIKEGFLPLSALSYAAHIKESLQEFSVLKQKLADPASISDDELEKMYTHARKLGFRTCKEEIFQKGLKLTKNPYFLIEQYEAMSAHCKRKDPELLSLRRKIFSMDSKNQKGTHLRMAIIDFMRNVSKSKPQTDPKQVVAPLIEYCEKFGEKDVENRWKVEMMIAQYLFSKNKTLSAVQHAKCSCDAAPEIVKKEVEQTLQFMQKNLE